MRENAKFVAILSKMLRICVDFKYQIVVLRWKLAETCDFERKSQENREKSDVFKEIKAILQEDYRLWSETSRKYAENKDLFEETREKTEESVENYRDISIKNANLLNFASLVKPKRFIPSYYNQKD